MEIPPAQRYVEVVNEDYNMDAEWGPMYVPNVGAEAVIYQYPSNGLGAGTLVYDSGFQSGTASVYASGSTVPVLNLVYDLDANASECYDPSGMGESCGCKAKEALSWKCRSLRRCRRQH